jgi:hypothetical protein
MYRSGRSIQAEGEEPELLHRESEIEAMQKAAKRRARRVAVR